MKIPEKVALVNVKVLGYMQDIISKEKPQNKVIWLFFNLRWIPVGGPQGEYKAVSIVLHLMWFQVWLWVF